MDYRTFINQTNNLVSKAQAWDSINTRSDDAHAYCQNYLMPDAWGKNVWISILDDAIRMRKELEANKKS